VKALLMLLLLVAVAWWWRNRQSGNDDASPLGKPTEPKPLDMVRCSHCGMHIPSNEAVVGKNGLYCSAHHRQQAEH
jgi:uncharacterized protein